jgi:hypothetical protein
MAKFGKTPPRALESFGVAGLLGEKSKVFYCSLFSSRHVGRVSDLICARLLEEGLDELRLRALLLFGSFEVFKGNAATPAEISTQRLNEPLVVECGVDDDKIAIGIAFSVQEGRFPKLDGLVSRISGGKPEGDFESLLAEIYRNSDHTVMRAQGGTRRIEIVAMMGIPGKIDAQAVKARAPLEVVDLDRAIAVQAPSVQAYIELGDLDYPELLRDSPMGAGMAPPNTGQVLAQESTALQDAIRIKGQAKIQDKSETLVKGSPVAEDDTETLVSGSHGEDDADTVVRGGGSGQDDSVALVRGKAEDVDDFEARISGKAVELGGDAVLVKGAHADARDESVFKVAGNSDVGKADTSPRVVKGSGSSGTGDSDEAFVVSGGSEPARKGSMRMRKSSSGAEEGEDSDSDSQDNDYVLKRSKSIGSEDESEAQSDEVDQSEEEDSEEEVSTSGFKGLFGKVKKAWPFRRRVSAEEEDGDESEETTELDDSDEMDEETSEAVGKKKNKKKSEIDKVAGEVEQEDVGEKAEEAEVEAIELTQVSTVETAPSAVPAASELEKEIESGMGRAIKKVQDEAAELKQDVGGAKAKRWVDGLMSELVAEKSRLHDMAKQLNGSIRQKEHEFRNKEQLLRQELLRRDDLVRQKDNALNRAKDQLSQAAIAAERLKSAKQGAGDDAHYKQKHALVQKLLSSAKDENATLTEKVDDLKNQLASAQLTAKRNGPSTTDFAALQNKYERSIRQAEEFKKANQQLLDKLNDAKKDRAGGAQDETKKRLDQAMKMVTANQKESEKLYQKIEDMQKEQMRLQAELNRKDGEIRAARKTQANAAVAPSGAAAAPAPGATPPSGMNSMAARAAAAKAAATGSTKAGSGGSSNGGNGAGSPPAAA